MERHDAEIDLTSEREYKRQIAKIAFSTPGITNSVVDALKDDGLTMEAEYLKRAMDYRDNAFDED